MPGPWVSSAHLLDWFYPHNVQPRSDDERQCLHHRETCCRQRQIVRANETQDGIFFSLIPMCMKGRSQFIEKKSNTMRLMSLSRSLHKLRPSRHLFDQAQFTFGCQLC